MKRLYFLQTFLLLCSGTFAQTVQQVKDIYPGNGSSNPSYLVSYNSILLFSANDSVNGEELWVSDGTNAGTSLVKDINPGVISSSPRSLVQSGSLVFFRCDDGTYGWELWKSDGTSSGTELVKDIEPGSAGSMDYYWSNMADIGDTLFFNPSDGGEIWQSDGTSSGTVMIKDLYSGFSTGALYSIGNLTNVNGTAFFVSPDDGTNGRELWKSDGTSGGTVMIKDINPGAGSGMTGYRSAVVNGTLFFRADDGANGIELWKSDGTVAGTVLVKDINPGSLDGFPANFINVNGTLFFNAKTDTLWALWKSDGTTAGTVKLKDFKSLDDFYNVNGTLYFNAHDWVNGRELWKSDGTTSGTVMVKDINPGSGGGREYPAISGSLMNNFFYFTANDGTNGVEIWKTDGTASNTVKITDFQNDSIPWSEPREFTVVNDTILFFTVEDSASGRELWVLKDTATVSGILQEERLNSMVQIYPNPFSENATITVSPYLSHDQVNFKIFNIMGQEMEQIKIDKQSIKLNRNRLPAGMYLWQLQNQSAIIQTGKLVIH